MNSVSTPPTSCSKSAYASVAFRARSTAAVIPAAIPAPTTSVVFSNTAPPNFTALPSPDFSFDAKDDPLLSASASPFSYPLVLSVIFAAISKRSITNLRCFYSPLF